MHGEGGGEQRSMVVSCIPLLKGDGRRNSIQIRPLENLCMAPGFGLLTPPHIPPIFSPLRNLSHPFHSEAISISTFLSSLPSLFLLPYGGTQLYKQPNKVSLYLASQLYMLFPFRVIRACERVLIPSPHSASFFVVFSRRVSAATAHLGLVHSCMTINQTKAKRRKRSMDCRGRRPMLPVQNLYETCRDVFADGKAGYVPPPEDIDRLKSVLGTQCSWFRL